MKRVERARFRLSTRGVPDAQRGPPRHPIYSLPGLYNALHFIPDPEELAIHNNAAFILRRFVGVAASDSPSVAEPLFVHTTFPVLKNVLRLKTELVRAKALGVIAHSNVNASRHFRRCDPY